MATLYEINENYKQLLDAIAEGEIPEEAAADTLEAVEGEFYQKVDNIACFIKNLESDTEALKTEAKSLTDRAKTKQSTADRLRKYLSDTLQKNDRLKFETVRNKISFRKSEAVEISDGFIEWAKQNNDTLLKYKEPEPDKTAIKEAIKSGVPLTLAQIVSNENIQIK